MEVVRLYTGGKTSAEGAWFTTREEIQGLTSAELKSKFGLMFEPTHVSPAIIQTENSIRIGIAKEVKEFSATGSGLQIELLNNGNVTYRKPETISGFNIDQIIKNSLP